MATTYTLISSVTVGSGGAANIEFTSIPQTYTDLVVMLSGRTTANGDNYGETDLSFNGAPTGTAYSWRNLEGRGVSAFSSSGSSDSAIYLRDVNGSGSTASTFSNNSFYIPNYTSSNNKSISANTVTENNFSQAIALLTAGLWADSSAITSLRFTVTYGTSFAQYSTAYLYGISNS
jgi:hypothetical protein